MKMVYFSHTIQLHLMRFYLLLLSLFHILFTQAQDFEINNLIGSPTDRESSANIVTDASGNIYVGGTMNNKTLIVKQDVAQQTIWSKTLSLDPVASNAVILGFLDIVGDTLFGCGDVEQFNIPLGTFYFKMNAQTGAIYWSKYELSSGGYLSSMRYANGKFFLVGGTLISNSMTHGKVMAVSSQTGDMIWETPLLNLIYPAAGAVDRTYFTNATEMRNGKMFITGMHQSNNIAYPSMPIVVGINEFGTVFLQRRLSLPFIQNATITNYQASRIEYDMNDDIILTSFNNGPMSNFNDPNIVLTKLDQLGNTLFSKEYEIDGEGAQQVHGLNETANSYVLCGVLHSNFTGLYSLKLNKNGDFQKCIGLQKPGIYFSGGSSNNAYGNSDFKPGTHYFAASEMLVPAGDINISEILLDEDLNTINNCSESSELPVIVTTLTTQLEPLQLIEVPDGYSYLNGIVMENLELYIPCDSLSLDLQQTSACQTEVTATVSGFYSPRFYWSNGTVSSSNTLPISTTDTVIVRVLDIRCCELIDTIVPVLSSNMSVSLGADTSFCLQSGQTFQLTPTVSNPNGPVSYLWNTNAVTPSISINTSGTYWVEVSDDCINRRDSIQITVFPFPEISGLSDSSICEGTFPVILSPTVTQGASILWENGQTTIPRTITAPGTYSLQISNSCGTIDSTITITQTDLPDVSLVSTIDSCLHTGQSIFLVPVLNNVTTVTWSDGTNGNQLSVSQSGTYLVYGSNSCGIDSASCLVTIREFPELNLPSTLDTCFEIGIGFFYTAQGNQGSYSWNSGSLTATELITQEGLYICTLTNTCGTAIDSMIVNRLAELELYFPDDSVQVCSQQISQNLLGIETNYHYQLFAPWTHQLVNGPLTESGWYRIRAFNPCGELWDSIYVDLQNEQAIYLPNSFTPNHDGTNDQLEIATLNATISDLRIFNRWGEELYKLQSNNNVETAKILVWDGNYSGRPCPDGVYQVQVIYTNCFGIPTSFTGHIHLIR